MDDAPLHVAHDASHAAQLDAELAEWSDGQTARHAPLCRYGAYAGHDVHCEDDGPLQVRQPLSQLWQTLSESA